MIPLPFPDSRTWAHDNFATVDLKDRRRTQRLLDTAEKIVQQPEGSLPSKFSWNPLRGVYRLCHRPEVTHTAVTAPHFALTRVRMGKTTATVLILHDTTELDFTTHWALQGTGPIGNGVGRGFLQHNSLAVEAESRRVVGLAYQQVDTRKPAPKGEKRAARQRRERESQLWERGIRGVGPAPAGACWVDIADRGADNIEAMQAALAMRHQFLFRACKDRAVVVGPTRRLKPWVRSLPSQAKGKVVIPSRGGRLERTARVRMTAAPAWVLVPQLVRPTHRDWEPIQVWVERIWEPNPPADVEEPLGWILLSSLPAATPKQLGQHRDWYACRPLIEEFHQAEKTGCGEEDLRFETAEALLPMLGLLAVVAIRVLQLRWWCQEGEAAPACSAATREELEVLKGLGQKVTTARDFVRAVAGLGGFLGRKGDGEPGWQRLWRGHQRLQDMVVGFRLKKRDTRASPK